MKFCARVIRKYGHWLFLGLMILITLLMNVYVATNILDGDASWPFVKGWVIAQQRNILTNDLYFTTEVSLFDTETVAAAFFLLIDNWTVVRILSTVVMQAYYVLSFLYLCRQVGVKHKNAILAAGALLIPFSTPYARAVLYHLYYISYIANAFWMMGLTIRLLRRQPHQRHPNLLPALMLAGLWILMGTNGIRYMMVIGAPMLLFAGVQLIFTLNQYTWTDDQLRGPKQLGQEPAVRLTVILLCSCACFLAGFIINKLLILPNFDVANMSATYFRPTAEAERYSQIFNGWLVATGIRNSAMALVGVRGLGLIASLAAFGYLLISSFSSIFVRGDLDKRFMHGMLGAAFATTTLIFVFESTERTFELYYVPVVSLAAATLAQELEKLTDHVVALGRKLLILLACACFLFQGVYSLYFICKDQQWLDQWSALGYQQMDTVDQVSACVDFLQENGYTHALINYWYANTMIEMSDGTVYAAGFEDEYVYSKTFPLYRWGMPKSPFAPENLPEKIVVFVKQAESEQFETLFPDALPVHFGNCFFGYEVDAALVK